MKKCMSENENKGKGKDNKGKEMDNDEVVWLEGMRVRNRKSKTENYSIITLMPFI